MKPALLIIMLVCTTTAACTARAAGIGLGDPTPPATAIPLDQGPASQAVSSSDAAPSSDSADTGSDQHAAGLHNQLSTLATTKTVVGSHHIATPNTVNTPPATSDDTGHSHAASWQSLLPGSIQ